MLYAIIPGYNEGERIIDVIERTKKYIPNVIVVDDGSSDNTKQLAEKAGAIVLRNIVNMGKGCGMRLACDWAFGHKHIDSIICLDADGQHLPEELPLFIEGLKENDLVLGYRRLNKPAPIVLQLGNFVINTTFQILFGRRFKDTQSGYRAFTKKAYEQINWNADRYFVETEMLARSKGLKIKEVEISTVYKDKYKGTTIIDGIKIVLQMLLLRVKL